MKKKKPVVVLAAGGTGGHIYPAESLAKYLEEGGCEIFLISDKKGADLSTSEGWLKVIEITVQSVSGKTGLGKVVAFLSLLKAIFQVRRILKKLHPQAVIGFGGYASFPTMVAAVIGKHKTIIHEQNAIMGRANRFLASRVNVIATSFRSTQGVPVNAKTNVIMTGMPVRQNMISKHGRGYPKLSKKSKLRILIAGGSQGASVLSKVVPDAIRVLGVDRSDQIEINQQCRQEDYERLEAIYQQLGVYADVSVFYKDIADRLRDCHLFIGRAGASTIAELKVVGRPSILIPYPFAFDDHQTRNAFEIEQIGGGWLIPEPLFTADELARRLKIFLRCPRMLDTAASSISANGNPKATEFLGALVLNDGSKHLSRDIGLV